MSKNTVEKNKLSDLTKNLSAISELLNEPGALPLFPLNKHISLLAFSTAENIHLNSG